MDTTLYCPHECGRAIMPDRPPSKGRTGYAKCKTHGKLQIFTCKSCGVTGNWGHTNRATGAQCIGCYMGIEME